MSKPNELNPLDDQIEACLDIQATSSKDAAESADRSAAMKRQLELQERIDMRLAQLFECKPPSAELVVAMLADSRQATAVRAATERTHSPRVWRAAAGLAVAAAIAWLAFTISIRPGRFDAPEFAAEPLTDIYRAAVADGFEPYYECREADRFADTFARRQGKSLQLLPMPLGASMLGLSYPGGLSRDTTAMLCRVDHQPVIVFVDRAEADQAIAMAGADATLRVFREERAGLVFYEVTPFAEPRMMKQLAPLESAAAPPKR